MKKVDDKLYFIYFDSTKEKKMITKATLVEFNDFVALIEMPIGNGGADQKSRTDLTTGGAEFYEFIQKQFPKKPLKYIFSTHWHEHSVSSVLPFIYNGVKIVTTKDNFEYIRQMLGKEAEEKYGDNFIYVEDSIVIKDKKNTVIGYRFTKKDYPAVPTKDFIYYYLPKYNYMNVSCMHYRYGKEYSIDGKEMVYGRSCDMYNFCVAKNLKPSYVITTYGDLQEPNSMLSFDTLDLLMTKTGTTEDQIKAQLLSIDKTVLQANTDSVIKSLIDRKIGGYLINATVYKALRERKLDQALALARMLCLMYPASSGYWDTYGEVYYFQGNTAMAKRYEKHCKAIDKDFAAGEEVWKKEIEEYKQYWQEHNL